MRSRVVPALLVLAMVFGVGGCATLTSSGAAEERARLTVLQMVQSLTTKRPDIDDFARAIDVQFARQLALTIVQIEEYPDAAHGDAFGKLTFLVADSPVQGGFGGTGVPQGPFCFDVEFSYFGYEGDRARGNGVDGVDCPADTGSAVTPDETLLAVLAPNSAEAARQVLTEQGGGSVSSETLKAAISQLLVAPDGEFETAAQPDVIVLDSKIGVALGDAEDCVLVSWVEGVVTDVSAPSVMLQPGELGCRASTAIADPDQLGPPH